MNFNKMCSNNVLWQLLEKSVSILWFSQECSEIYSSSLEPWNKQADSFMINGPRNLNYNCTKWTICPNYLVAFLLQRQLAGMQCTATTVDCKPAATPSGHTTQSRRSETTSNLWGCCRLNVSLLSNRVDTSKNSKKCQVAYQKCNTEESQYLERSTDQQMDCRR